MATRPFLVIDLEKSWREEQHPRDKHGKFTSVKGGSRVVTSTGKTGVVNKNAGGKITVSYDGGGTGTLHRDNVLHENDHKKVQKEKKKTQRKRKQAGKKQSSTKAQQKANATQKPKTIKDPTKKTSSKKSPTQIRSGSTVHTADGLKGKVNGQTADGKSWLISTEDGKKVKRAKHRVTHANDVKGAKSGGTKTSKKKTKPTSTKQPAKQKQTKASQKPEKKPITNYGEAPKVENKPIPKGENSNNKTQNKQVKEFNDFGSKGETASIDDMWNSKAVQDIMNKKPEKRSEEDIRQVAGAITEANKKLAFSLANKRAEQMGFRVMKNYIGNSNSPDRIAQETGARMDMIQGGLSAMYETLHNVMSGAENPGKEASVGAHVTSRMKQQITKDLYGLMNSIPVPHRVRKAVGDMKKAENELSQKLGRQPSDEELGNHLMENSEAFKNSPIVKPPRWDDTENRWIATNKQEKDPAERLKVLKRYADQQRTASSDKQVNQGSEDRELTVADSIADDNRTPEENYERKERQEELKGELPKAMKEMKLDHEEIQLMSIMFSDSSPNSKKKGQLTINETLDIFNKQNGTDRKKSWVHKKVSSAMQKIAQAREENHPAMERLRSMFKSFVMNMILKAIYEMDLVKSLHSWGLDTTVLKEQHTRTAYGDNLFEIKKSLEPTEYVASYITSDSGKVRAHIVEHTLPSGEELQKAFNMFGLELTKSMFPHKGGSNHAVNQKATDHIKKNKGKYKAIADTQKQQLNKKQAKGGKLTWSEQLAIDKKGFWISWGGKRILIQGEGSGFGEVAYDSRNEAHREEHNEGAQEDKIDFHHEEEGLAEHRAKKEAQARKEWEEGAKDKKGNAFNRWANQHNIKRDGQTPILDEEGNLQFDHGDDSHVLDHGIGAFNDQLQELHDRYHGEMKKELRDEHGHKSHAHYSEMNEDERKAYDNMDEDEKAKATGNHFLNKEGIKDHIHELKNNLDSAQSDEEKQQHAEDFLNKLKEGDHGSKALVNKNLVTGKGAKLSGIAGKIANADLSSEDGMNDVAHAIGKAELSRSKEEVGKNILPEGKFTIGNPQTGKSMIVSVGHSFDGGRGGDRGQFASVPLEAFDPQTGEHHTFEGVKNSWGKLADKLGLPRNTKFAENANKGAGHPAIKEVSEEEFEDMRKNTKAGLKDSMLHTDFDKVDERSDKEGNVQSRTFAQDMPDGTQNVVEVDSSGYIKDPIMARLVQQREPINSTEDLHRVLKDAVGNTAWVTAHIGSDIHHADALGHHVKLMYDGKGAPRVVGGEYDGHRFLDKKDVPKGSIDPHTGEPVKALFKNGKLVDRKFSTKNDVEMKKGNPVMYQDGTGKWKKGRINDVQDGTYKVTDGKGNLMGMYSKNELKPAKVDGKMNAKSGKAVVKLTENNVHRMNPSEVFKPEGDGKRAQARAEKAQNLFTEALKKAKVKTHAFESDGSLKKDIELSEPEMKRLQKVLGRSKAGKQLLKQFKKANKGNQLELHVPEHKRAEIEAEGVTVRKDGTATISTAKFEKLRETLGGVSLESKARDYLNDHFRSKDRTPQSPEQLKAKYQPSAVSTKNKMRDDLYKKQFKEDSFLLNPDAGLFSTQLEGIGHLVERKRGIAGHGMGTGKTILGVMAGMHYKADKLAQGRKPKKTLIVAPKGIMSDWGKEIGGHTNSKALYVGNGLKNKGQTHPETGRTMYGQEGTEQESVTKNSFLKNMDTHGSEDHDFHIMSYETFANMRDKLTDSGMYDNIVIDEIHAFKNKASNRGASLAETTDKFENVWGLSGTPMENDAREVYNLIDTVTGGKHELGSKAEFQEEYMIKDRKGKLTGVNPNKSKELGDIIANTIQFRGGTDVVKNDGSNIQFPHLAGKSSEDGSNPPTDFIGNMVDGNRDHKTNEYYGTKHSVTDFKEHELGEGDNKTTAYTPENLDSTTKAMYDRYSELQNKYLPESKLNELVNASSTGYDRGKKGKSNYLTAMQKLQKFLNAPLADKMYVGKGQGNAIESDATDAQGEATGAKKKSEGLKPYNPETGEGHYNVDENGHKRYFETDGKGGFKKNADGTPKELPPLHHNNPKAQYLKKRLTQYLDNVRSENAQRRKDGKPELMPKVVVKSDFTTFGTDIVDGVLRDLQHSETGHPELRDWAKKTGDKFGAGRFTGDAEDRESTKTGFRGNKKNYANEQGHLWATTVSPAGKEGVDFGNAHAMFHFDQNWNPQKMAQFTARVRRADSHEKAHASVDRANSVRVESLHMPGTIEDFIFNAQDSKMRDINKVTTSTRQAEEAPKYGDSASGVGRSSRGFTRNKTNRAGAKPKKAQKQGVQKPGKSKKTTSGGGTTQGKAVAKGLKFVVML